jgi:hypothetical protein
MTTLPHTTLIALFALFSSQLLATPASALTKQQKTETCKFGADDQKLTGAKRKAFMSRCMASENAPTGKPAKKQ